MSPTIVSIVDLSGCIHGDQMSQIQCDMVILSSSFSLYLTRVKMSNGASWGRECCDKISNDQGSNMCAALYISSCVYQNYFLLFTPCPSSKSVIHLARLQPELGIRWVILYFFTYYLHQFNSDL